MACVFFMIRLDTWFVNPSQTKKKTKLHNIKQGQKTWMEVKLQKNFFSVVGPQRSTPRKFENEEYLQILTLFKQAGWSISHKNTEIKYYFSFLFETALSGPTYKIYLFYFP